ncbi:MAG: glycosyltransferase [Phycisphaerales bacterium]|nr:MAG: glycosyltransferase [Phycisphaerales bacterium]
MANLRLLMLNYEFPPIGGGGGQAHFSLLTQYAQRDDLTVDVLTSAPQPGLTVETLAENVRIHKVGIHKQHLHFWRKAEVLEWLRRAKAPYRCLLRDNTYDLVHAFFGFPTGWLCYRTARRLPYVISLRGSDVPGDNARLQREYKLLGPLVFKRVWKRAAALVACSEGLKARALRFLSSAQIEVIPNGVDLERFRPAETGSSTENQPLKLLTVGRLSATKRLNLLIDAVEHLRAAGAQVKLDVIGGGALEVELRQLLALKDLRDVVTLAGRHQAQEMPEIYRRHDVFVSASSQEGMSNAMLEAMASGLPIVATRCEGLDELIADNGLIVDEAAPDTLAQAIRTLVDDQSKREAMAVAARKQAEKFNWGAVAEAYLQLYAKVT